VILYLILSIKAINLTRGSRNFIDRRHARVEIAHRVD